MVVKYYCDACGEEIENYGDSYHIKIEPRNMGSIPSQFNEICEKCAIKVKELLIKK
jgi:hypothetical protein